MNALSIDVEDWFCTHNISHLIPRENWEYCELRVAKSTERILRLLEKHNTRATFFILGWIAERLPQLVQEIEQRGHEIGVHGYNHLLLTKTTPVAFEEDLTKAIAVLKGSGLRQEILGFRAPSFTLVESTRWALPILERHNIRYDSSVFPVGFHPDYGMPEAPLTPFKITENLYEFPLTCIEIFGRRIPCSGGAYFRIFPYFFIKLGIKKCNAQGRPAIFYLHPWELDPEQPRIKLPWMKRFRHYYNLHKVEDRLDRLLSDFHFTTVKEVLNL